MNLALLAKLVHVLLGIGLVAGLVGRTVVMHRARQVDDVRLIDELAGVAGSFDRRLVIPCSQLVVLLGLATAWLQGWPILGFLVGGTSNWLLAALVLFLGITALVPTVFIPTGKVFEAALRGAVAQGALTSELSDALADRRVRRAHIFEAIAIFAILVLMITKPI